MADAKLKIKNEKIKNKTALNHLVSAVISFSFCFTQ